MAMLPRLGAAMPFEQAVRLAALRDPVVAALREDVAQQETNIEILKDGKRPRFSVNVGRASALGTDPMLAAQQNIGSEIVATQMLFDWGKVSAQIEGATYDRVQIVSDFKKQLETVIFNISGLYLDADTARAKLDATAEYRKNAQKLNDMTVDRAQGGFGDLSETTRAKLVISRAQERQRAFESNLDIALTQLNLLVGVSDIATEDVPELAYGQQVDTPQALDASIKGSPDYLKANAAVDSARAGIDVAKAANKPALSVQAAGHPGFSDAGPTSASVGLILGVNLGMSDLFGRQAQAAEQKYEGSRKRRDGTVRDLTNQAHSYAKQIETLAASVASLKIQVEEARKVVTTYEDQFSAGLRNMTDLFTSIDELYSSQLNLIDTADQLHRTEYKAAEALGLQGTLLQAKTGAPLPDLPTFLSVEQLQLPMPRQVQQPTAPFDDPGHYSMLPFAGRGETP
ncbi:TolC family protein [Burkholderia pyrrocinia]|uniref:TolC family protein n=1 Tax=Burkholderia pyrrocinia TaxID=60550 RepID=UPI002AB14212|nr:TolC family protein [Burkholderia pyrrocinia]